nr:retrovirus-related Pol polyprotein from transposon TNT 1-94 [Tanacetum cinerariifolium]
MTNNINHFKELVDQAWVKHTKDHFRALTAQDMDILIKTCLMPLSLKTQNDSFIFVHELKQEMHADLKYVESLEKEIDKLEYDKAEFSNMYDTILQECVSNDVMCTYLHSLSGLDAQCLYLHKAKECDCLAQKLSKQTESVSKEVYTELLRRFAKHSISLKLALQKFLGKPTPFSYSLERKYFAKTKLVPKTNVSEGLSKTIIAQTLPQTARQVIVQLILFIVDSGCTKHMTSNLKLLYNFVKKYLGTVRFGNDQFAPILGYGDLVQGNIMINRVYYVEGLNHNLLSVGQFCDADLEVAFWKSTCFVRDLQGNDLLIGNYGSNLYTISLQESTSSNPLCLMAKASPTQAWLFHRRLSHLNFDYINLLSKKDVMIGLPKLKYVKDQLCSSCEVSKAKRSSFKSKAVPSLKGRLNFLHMDLCGPMRVASINGKKYILIKDHPLEQVRGNPPKPVQTRRKLAIDLEMCMFALTVSTAEPKNIMEAMANSAWIEAMQKELHEFDRLQVWELVDKPFVKFVIRLKWLWKNKKDEDQTVYQLRKALYELKKAPKAWYGELSKFLTSKGFTKDADHAGFIETRKSTSGGIQFLGDKLVSWMSKKHDFTAMSLTKAEYVVSSASCAQVITEYQLADMFTKALPEDRFTYLVRRIGMRCLTPAELEVLTNESA